MPRALKAAGALTSTTLATVQSGGDGTMAGIVAGCRIVKTRKGDRMAVFMLEDQTGSIEVVVYPEPYKQFASFIENDRMVVVTGRVEVDDERAKMRATEVKDLKQVTERFVKEVCVTMQAPPHGHETFRALSDVFLRHRGDKRVQFELRVRRDGAGAAAGQGRGAAAAGPAVRRAGAGRRADLRPRVGACCAGSGADRRQDETMPETLEFEEPIAILHKEIEALNMLPQTEVRDGEIEGLRRRIDQIRGEIYKRLTPWQRVLVARHPERPYLLDYVERLFTEFVELHGDRRFADDGAIVCGFARYHGTPVLVCGHQKGRDMKQKVQRNFGYARPEGYRKALRAMQMADKFGRPIIVFVDTPAAYPGVESEERGIAEAIALNLREMAILSVPIIVIVTGEGGSGGALGLAIGDRVLIQEFAVYSVIPPEGCAAILWRDASRKVEAAEALKITAPDLVLRGIVDGIVPEPLGGAHQDPDAGRCARSTRPCRRPSPRSPRSTSRRGSRPATSASGGSARSATPSSIRRRHGSAGGVARADGALTARCQPAIDAGSRSSGRTPPSGRPARPRATATRTSRRWPGHSTCRRWWRGCCASAASTRPRRRRASWRRRSSTCTIRFC